MAVTVIETIREMQDFADKARQQEKSIGFVPTMGFLHEGHISLVQQSIKDCDITVVSIFVNPTQFAPNEDFAAYPRDFSRDKQLLADAGVDAIFFPKTDEIYPINNQTVVSVTEMTKTLEGETRPTHFDGVTTIVSILFNSVKPHAAYFGRKDAQQAAVIKQMVRDLHIDVDISVQPILREEGGLAMSSRNTYMTPRERREALILYNSLQHGKELLENGEKDIQTIIDDMTDMVTEVDSASLDYITLVDENTFEEVEEVEKGSTYLFLIACRIGSTRLIDNLEVSL